MKGKLFAISGPSGVGKNSVLNRVMQLRDRVQYSISATSRPMRPGEVDGKSYYFVTRAQFEQMIADGELASVQQARDVIRDSFEIKIYEP